MKIGIMLLYVVLLVIVAIISSRKTKTMNDFLLAGRNIGPWLSAFAYGTTYFSAVVFVGYAGKLGWGFGLSVLWIVLGNALIGSFLAWKVLAKRTRRMTIKLNVMTMPSFLEKRYMSRGIKVLAAVIIFVFLVPYSASVCMGLSYFFESLFGLPYEYALIFIAVLSGFYLIVGGYTATVWIDFIQGIIMIAGVVFMVFFVVNDPAVGGIFNVIPSLNAIDPGLTALIGPGGFLPLFSLVILTSLGAWGLPQMVQKFYAINNERVIPIATWITTAFSLIIAAGAYFSGSLSRLFFNNLDQFNGNFDMIMPTIMSQTLPELLAIIILIMVLSASMSTLTSLVMTSSSTIAVDLLNVVKPDFDKKKQMILMRMLCGVFVLLSLFLALKPPAFIVELMALSWGAVAGSFLSVYVLGLFCKGITKAAAWVGVISGVVICVGGSILFPDYVPTAGCAAMILPLIIVPIVSKFTKPLPKEHIDYVFGDE